MSKNLALIEVARLAHEQNSTLREIYSKNGSIFSKKVRAERIVAEISDNKPKQPRSYTYKK